MCSQYEIDCWSNDNTAECFLMMNLTVAKCWLYRHICSWNELACWPNVGSRVIEYMTIGPVCRKASHDVNAGPKKESNGE